MHALNQNSCIYIHFWNVSKPLTSQLSGLTSGCVCVVPFWSAGCPLFVLNIYFFLTLREPNCPKLPTNSLEFKMRNAEWGMRVGFRTLVVPGYWETGWPSVTATKIQWVRDNTWRIMIMTVQQDNAHAKQTQRHSWDEEKEAHFHANLIDKLFLLEFMKPEKPTLYAFRSGKLNCCSKLFTTWPF